MRPVVVVVLILLVATVAVADGVSGAPVRPVVFAYADDLDDGDGLDAWAGPDTLVVAGRENVGSAPVRRVADAGGRVLLYLDAVVRNPHGRYHALLFADSACGPAVPAWPGLASTRYGPVADLRPGGVLDRKLACVLEATVADNPWIDGWFADDLGSRPWFAGVDHDAMSQADRIAYRDGAVALSRTFRAVADQHGMLVLVNGTWQAGPVERTGGGWPDPARDGNALADGGTVEHHDGQEARFAPYLCSSQWASRTGPAGIVIAGSHTGLRAYLGTGCVGYGVVQSDYGIVPPR